MTEPRLVFIDTETTGLNPATCEIWEIGLIARTPEAGDVEYLWQIRPDLRDAEPTGLRIGRYYQRCRIAHERDGQAVRIIHPQAAKDSAWAEEVAAEVARLLDGAFLVGAVPWFDERFLQKFLRNNGQAATNHYHLIDVENLAAGALSQPPPWGFDDLLAAYGLKYAEADRHTALGDARMARDLYDAVMGRDVVDAEIVEA